MQRFSGALRSIELLDFASVRVELSNLICYPGVGQPNVSIALRISDPRNAARSQPVIEHVNDLHGFVAELGVFDFFIPGKVGRRPREV